MPTTLATLPPELFSDILAFVPAEELQKTTYTLICALPSCPVPRHHLFSFIRLGYPEQALKLYLHLAHRDGSSSGEDKISLASRVRELSLETWNVDADIFINLIRLLPNLESLSLRIGPSNFSSEHLEELFTPAHYFQRLKYLSLRFRPYVQKANYIQFLKGAYFDSALTALSKWPQLPVLSIVQDPLDLTTVDYRQAFAQPIVFFRLDAISILLHSQALVQSPYAFRLRIPSRSIARALCTRPLALQGLNNRLEDLHLEPSDVNGAPSLLKYLDLSTCGLLETDVDMILTKYHALEHLVLDGCSMLRGELREGEWAAMGKRCALIGVKRAKEREKEMKSGVNAWQPRGSGEAGGGTAITAESTGRGRRGRRGLATATISLRDREPRTYGPSVPTPSSVMRPATKIRVLPPLPTLRSLSTTLSPLVSADKHAMIRAEFETGWAEGMAELAVARARVRANAGNGVHVLEMRRVVSKEGTTEDNGGMEEEERAAPVLCLVGAEAAEHTTGCGHGVGRQIWKDWDGVL